jgi:hypothetical protein
MGKVTLGKSVEELKAEEKIKVETVDVIEKQQISELPEMDSGFNLNLDETKFILAKLAQMEYKGVEIEFIYLLLQKIQNHLQYLISKRNT